ncbi:MAG: polysaccharide biosynthesis C-terminal domain-containing protein [Vicingaceae bacterium]
MGIIKRQTIKTSVVAYFGVLLGAANTLWLYPKFLTPTEIGLLNILTTIALIIAPIAQLGVNGVILKYYPFVKSDEKKRASFMYLILLIPFFGYLLAMLLLFICRNLLIENFQDSPLLVDYLFVLVPFSFILVGRNIADTFSRAQFRIAMPKFFKEVILRLVTFIVVILYSLNHMGLDFLVYGFIGAFGINLILMLFYLRQLSSIKYLFSLKPLGRELIRNSLIYGSYIILSGFAGMVITKIDSWMISSKLGLADNGIFTIALYIGLAIEMPKRSLNLISLPVISDAMKKNDIKSVKDLYQKSALIQLIIGSLVLICVWVNIDALFSLIPNSETYIQGKYVVLFIGLAVLFDMATGVNNEIILMSNFYRWNLFIVFGLIGIAVLNNLILIPIYGITGAAMATAISIFLYNVAKFAVVYKYLHIQPFTLKNLWALLLALATYLIGISLPDTPYLWLDIFYRCGLLSVLYLAVHYRLKSSPDLVKVVDQVIAKVRP